VEEVGAAEEAEEEVVWALEPAAELVAAVQAAMAQRFTG
jgi:hypothetical protein